MKKKISILLFVLSSVYSFSQSNISQNLSDSNIVMNSKTDDLLEKIHEMLINGSENEEKAKISANYIAKEMDWKQLYFLGYSDQLINFWIDIHVNILKDSFKFTDDFIVITQRMNDDKQYKNFAEKTAELLIKKDKSNFLHKIAPIVMASGKISEYNGALTSYSKGAPGTKATDLIVYKNGVETVLKTSLSAEEENIKTVLFFYASGCGYCENIFAKLEEGDYDKIASKKAKMIFLSGDKDEETFYGKVNKYHFKDFYCDYKSVNGINFQNYAITGIPTMFLLDKDSKILLRTSSLDELLNTLN